MDDAELSRWTLKLLRTLFVWRASVRPEAPRYFMGSSAYRTSLYRAHGLTIRRRICDPQDFAIMPERYRHIAMKLVKSPYRREWLRFEIEGPEFLIEIWPEIIWAPMRSIDADMLSDREWEMTEMKTAAFVSAGDADAARSAICFAILAHD